MACALVNVMIILGKKAVLVIVVMALVKTKADIETGQLHMPEKMVEGSLRTPRLPSQQVC